LLYAINRICYDIAQKLSQYEFGRIGHPYVAAYRDNCKPVIAIDEATDFSAIDLLAMHSFRHPELSSVTLSGDLMQRMTQDGLRSWEEFSNMVYSAEVKDLTISYRQTPTLLSLAQIIYQKATNINAEYRSYMDPDPRESKPLIKISRDKQEKMDWIAERIRDIDATYRESVGALPSVAVFVPSEEEINGFVRDLDDALEGDIPVVPCREGEVLGDRNAVRVYAIDKIKGLEFQAVFFHNLDDMLNLSEELLLKYLYVGLSRAVFYLGVTLSGNLDGNLKFLEEYFVEEGNWQLDSV
jgi:superfamily I DNA/RNA helicase